MRSKFCAILTLLAISFASFGQEERWEPQFKTTGYVALEYEYFKGLKYYPKDYAMGLTEAGLLVNYQPLENLTIRTVFVYRPGFDFDFMLNEACAEYRLNNSINIKIGRFLTPLSPMNTYYYAPVNNSATLPLIISHHEFFPLNIDAISLNGKAGDQFKFRYDVFFGGFRNTLWMETGALGLFGYENTHLIKDETTVEIPNVNSELSFGGGGQIGIVYQDYLDLGFGVFKSEDSFFEPVSQTDQIVKKTSYGLNLKAKYSTLQLLGEAWHSTIEILGGESDYDGGFVELSNTFNKITPFVRLERHEAAGVQNKDVNYNRYTAGVNYKPTFETTFKLEYVGYRHDVTDLDGVVATFIFSF